VHLDQRCGAESAINSCPPTANLATVREGPQGQSSVRRTTSTGPSGMGASPTRRRVWGQARASREQRFRRRDVDAWSRWRRFCPEAIGAYPNVKTYASAPGSRKTISTVRSRTRRALARAGRGGRRREHRARPRRRRRRASVLAAGHRGARGTGSAAASAGTARGARRGRGTGRRCCHPPRRAGGARARSSTCRKGPNDSPAAMPAARRRSARRSSRCPVRRAGRRGRSPGRSPACASDANRPAPRSPPLGGDELTLHTEEPLDDAFWRATAARRPSRPGEVQAWQPRPRPRRRRRREARRVEPRCQRRRRRPACG